MKIDASMAEPGLWYYGKRHGKLLCVEEAMDDMALFAYMKASTGRIAFKHVEGEIELLPDCDGWDWSRRRRIIFDDPISETKVVAQEVLPEDPDLDELTAACYALIHATCFEGDPIPEQVVNLVDEIAALLDDPMGVVLLDEEEDEDEDGLEDASETD